MTIEYIYNILKQTTFPVAYSHFETPQNPPYITYLVVNSNNFGADNKVYSKNNKIQIELYTNKKDLEAEQVLENVLDSASLFWDKTESYISSEKLFQIIYEVSI